MKHQTIFYIVRHGETPWNTERRIQGHTDNPLSEKGEQQARELANLLAQVHFDAFYSSDLSRARQTAEIIAEKQPVTTSEKLRERAMGQFEGKVVEKDVSYEEFASWFDRHDSEERKATGMESDVEVTDRVLGFLKELHTIHRGKTLLIASHASMMKALLVTVGFAKHAQLGGGMIKNTAFIKLGFDGEKFVVLETVGITRMPLMNN